MARRSSARLRAKLSTPQAQKVSDMGVEGMARTPLTAPKLSSLREDDETHTRPAETPRHGTPIKPSPEEMHPQKYQMSTAKPLDEARWLGFSSTKATHQTPTKTPRQAPASVLDKAPNFDFTFRRPSLQLSPEARALMSEKKEEAVKIRHQMAATQHGQASASDVLGRKLATPTAKVNRFSDVHMQAFKKMDSIADHPSAFRLDKSKRSPSKPDLDKPSNSLKRSPSKAELEAPSTSLKRSPSKAELEAPSTSLKRSPSKADLEQPSTSLPRPTSRGNLEAPAKRVKRGADDDAATTRPATPKDTKNTPRIIRPPPSLKSAKSARRTTSTMIPSFPRSPAKMGMTSASLQQPPPLLSKSPIKSPLKKSSAIVEEEADAPESPLLSRSPSKPTSIALAEHNQTSDEAAPASSKVPYLARSPSKMSVVDYTAGGDDDDHNKSTRKPDKTRLLSRSPSKIVMPEKPANVSDQTPGKPSLLSRFNLLRASPVKSILRTPQRLYSDDPFKVANGTHLSTPPNADDNKNIIFPQRPPKTAPVMKHVDFSASTKGLTNVDSAPDTPSKAPTPPSKDSRADEPSVAYPALPSIDTSGTAEAPVPKKAHRRMTMAVPSDFTFRVGGGISFAPSPRRVTSNQVKPSIRHVSAEPSAMPFSAKKRKISDVAEAEDAPAQKGNVTSDKENDDQERPAKRARSAAPPQQPRPSVAATSKTPTRKVPTLGVKPKSTQKPKEKRPGMLSQARLAMLATPKRR